MSKELVIRGSFGQILTTLLNLFSKNKFVKYVQYYPKGKGLLQTVQFYMHRDKGEGSYSLLPNKWKIFPKFNTWKSPTNFEVCSDPWRSKGLKVLLFNFNSVSVPKKAFRILHCDVLCFLLFLSFKFYCFKTPHTYPSTQTNFSYETYATVTGHTLVNSMSQVKTYWYVVTAHQCFFAERTVLRFLCFVWFWETTHTK